jgi:hypothetical protein
MAPPAERMKAMRERRRARGLRELRLVVPDALEGGSPPRCKTGRRFGSMQTDALPAEHASLD